MTPIRPDPVDLLRACTSLDLRVTEDGGDGSVILWTEGRPVAKVGVDVGSDSLIVSATTTVVSEAESRCLIADLGTVASDLRLSSIKVFTVDPVLRNECRRAGFTGEIRGPLQIPMTELSQGPRFEFDGKTMAQCMAELVNEIGAWPHVHVARNLTLVGAVRRAVMGAITSVNLVCDDDVGRLGFRVAVGQDLMPEALAQAVDTARRIRHRLRPWLDHLRLVWFERLEGDHVVARHAGAADLSAQVMHLNASFILSQRWIESRRRRMVRPSARPSATVSGPFTMIDATVAHESWHLAEAVIEARDYKASIQFRKALGDYLGVETLEQAVKGGERHASPARRIAWERLRDEVSPYAATSSREATAEMFKLWWCGTLSPLVSAFSAAASEALGVDLSEA